MRVLFVIRDDAHSNLGGDTIQMVKTKAALEDLGLTVEVRGPGELDDLPTYDIGHIFNLQTAAASWLAFQALRKKGIPTVLSPIYWDCLEFWFEFAGDRRAHWRWLARLLGKTKARSVYTAWQRRKAPITGTWRTQRRLLERALRVLPNSQSEADLLRSTFALNRTFHQKVDVVPNGVDAKIFDPIPSPSQGFLKKYGFQNFVLEVGTISPTKNQLRLIEALHDLPVPLVFVGQPVAGLPKYVETCRLRGAERGNVIFVDRLRHEQLPGIYALAAVHVMPSWRETPGLASLEAAAAGCRVVSTSIGSARDYFGDLAWYCYPDDLASIRAAIDAALNAPPSDTLRKHVLTQFTWRRAAKATLASYQAALDQE